MNSHVGIRVFSACVILMHSSMLLSQKELSGLLAGKQNLTEIMTVVDSFYEANPELTGNVEEESPLLHWKRWEWYMSGRLGRHGEIVNIPEKLMEGLRQKERMQQNHERNINSGWTFVGPSNSTNSGEGELNGIGRVDRIVFHPTNPNIIFICAPSGGLWSSLNAGSTWNNLTDNLPSIGASGFVISYANTSTMYLLTGDGDSRYPYSGLEAFGYVRPCIGVLKSTDGGVSWHQTGNFPFVNGPYGGYQLVQSPEDPDLLFAATSNGLYRTDDGGETWIRKLSIPVYDVDFKPGEATRVYASVEGDFWVSSDSGNFWFSNGTWDINPSTCGVDGGRIQIGVTPASPNNVYLFAGPVTGNGQFCGLYLSTNSGSSFTRMSNTPNVFGGSETGAGSTDQSYYDIAIACRPNVAGSLAVAGLTVWSSEDHGDTWTHSTSYRESGSFPYIHPDVHDLAYNPLNTWLWAATDGGVYRSTDFGFSWTNAFNTIETSMYYHMTGWDGNLNKLLGGLQDNGVKYRRTNSSSFAHISGGDGFDVVFNPDTGEPAYATINDAYAIYDDDGNSFSAYVWNEDYFFQTLAVHNTNPDTVFLGTNNIWKSTNGALNWANKGAAAGWAMTSCPSSNVRFYAAGGDYAFPGTGAVYFSNDIGETWTDKSVNPGFPDQEDYTKITDVQVKPNTSGTVYASFGGFVDGVKVVYSTNTGDTWTNISLNLPNVPVNCLAIDNSNNVYAGTDIGVFYKSASMTQWMPWSNGLPNVPVTELVIYDDGTTKRIRASTFGRGIWQSNLASTCDPAVIVAGNLEGIRHYEAGTSLSSTSFVQGGIGTFVSFQAGNYITLSEGFNVVDESEFLGFISPCGDGGIPSVNGNEPINRSDPNSSIILLRRMWDPADGLPYGAIKYVDLQTEKVVVNYSIKNDARVELVAARQYQEKLETLYAGDQKRGLHTIEKSIAHLPHEFHYVILLVDGKVAHFQELDLR